MTLTKNDLQNVREIAREEVIEGVKAITGPKFSAIDEDLKTIKNNISHLPTKKEFFDYMDKLMTEVKESRQEEMINTHRINNHDSRIIKVEQVIFPD